MRLKNNVKGFLNILQIIIKLALVVFLVAHIYVLLDRMFAKKDVDRAIPFHSLPEDSLDIAVIGSSHSQYSFIPNYMFNDLNLYSYVMGSACQPLEVSYQMLKEIYKTQNPKLVVLEVYTSMPLSKGCEGDSCYVIAAQQTTGEEKKKILSYLPQEKAKTYLNEFINNHNNWRTIKSIEELEPVTMKMDLDKTNNNFGYIDAYPKLPVENYWSPMRYAEDVEVELRKKDQEALNNILALCKEHGSELMLYKTPIDSITQVDQSSLHKVWEWANENNVKYVDFVENCDSLGFHMVVHTDSGHAYVNGASIISNYLSDFIRDNYPNIFNHKQNDILDKKYHSLDYELLKGVLKTEYNPLIYLNRIFKYKGPFVIRYNKYISGVSDELHNKLVSLGVREDFDSDCYFAVYDDRKLLVESSDILEAEVRGHQIRIDTDHVYLDGTEIEKWTGSPMSITVFDDKLQKWTIKEINTKTSWDFGYTFYNE